MTRLNCGILALAALGQYANAKEAETCTLYLAETIDDHGRFTMGVFTAKDLPPGSPVGMPDVVVPLVDMPMHNSPTHEDQEELWSSWKDFVWDAVDVGGSHEGIDVKSAALGLGSLTRGISELANVMLIQSHFDNSGLHRSRDPGAGAVSYYHGAAMVSTDTIPAGRELHLPHGYHWFLDPNEKEDKSEKEDNNLLDNLPIDHPQVQEFFKRYQDLEGMHGQELTDELKSKLWSVLRESPLDDSIKTLLPESWIDASRVANHVTKSGLRTPEWLQDNGICIDNIKPGQSTIAQAGRGAFANRSLKEGSVIAPAPLVHILDRTSLNMFEPQIADDYAYLGSEVAGKQLMLNYCFGHEKSTKLLCPIGAGTSFINHSPTPNAAIRWSTHPSMTLHRQQWLNLTLDQLGDKVDVGLVMEYVALRDIEPGEEIFINYGPAWEKAWEEHVHNWVPLPGSKDYVSAENMNADGHDIIKTVQEQEDDPYPHSVVTSCYYDYDPEEEGFFDMSGEFANPNDHDVIIKEWHPLNSDVPDYMFLRPCVVLEREDVEVDEEGKNGLVEGDIDHDYTVHILNYDHMHADQKVPDYEYLVVTTVPRDAITFTDFIYSTDMHLSNAFRHEMMMDDSMFPTAWRNLS